MQNKPLVQAELDLLEIMHELHAKKGPFLRSELSVVGRGRGMDVARHLIRLKSLGLVEEIEKAPFFLWRLFGAKPSVQLKMTAAGLAAVAPKEAAAEPLAPEAALTQEPRVEEAPEPQAEAALEARSGQVPLGFEPPSFDPFPVSLPEIENPVLEAAPHDLPPVSTPIFAPAPPLAAAEPEAKLEAPEPAAPEEAAIEEAPIVEAPAEEPAKAEAVAAPVEVAESEADEAAPKAVQEAPAPAVEAVEAVESSLEAPVEAEVETQPEETAPAEAEDTNAPEAKSAAETPAPVAEAPVAPAPLVLPKPKPVPRGYTDELGGAPVAVASFSFAPDLAPERLDDMREMLGELSLELTMAGETLLADRVNKGATSAEALMQVAVFAFAHAARFDLEATAPADAEALHEYGLNIISEMGKLKTAGEIGDAAFERDSALILALSNSKGDRAALLNTLMSDPIGAAAPPALLPEELRSIEEFDEDED